MFNLWRILSTKSCLPRFELDPKYLYKKHAPLRPFDPNIGFLRDPYSKHAKHLPLEFTGWELAHAIVKADHVKNVHGSISRRLSLLALFNPVLHWNSTNLRLADGESTSYHDFSGTSLSGRLGQGITTLLMDQLGLSYYCHYDRPATLPGPDFVFENHSFQRCLVESKGSFVKPGSAPPDIKGILRDGLSQMPVTPNKYNATKSFVVGTFLRETSDNHIEPSLIAYTDPELTGSEKDEVPDDYVIRCNYAAWLNLMGHHARANALQRSTYMPKENLDPLIKVEINGVPFGVVPVPPAFRRIRDNDTIVVAGLQMSVIEAIRAATSQKQMRLITPRLAESQWKSRVGNDLILGSILGDGTFLGALHKSLISFR